MNSDKRRKNTNQGRSSQPEASNKHGNHNQNGRYREHHYFHYDQSNRRVNSDAGGIAEEMTGESSNPDYPAEPHPYHMNPSNDVVGVRQLIFDNAAICFPHLVDKYAGGATEAFKVSILALYFPFPSCEEQAQRCDYQAALAYSQPGEAKHQLIARGGGADNIPAALQSLLVTLGDCLTRGAAQGPLLEVSGGVYGASFRMRGAHVDGLAMEEGRRYAERTHGDNGTRQNAGGRQSDGKRQSNGKRQSGGRAYRYVS